MKKVWVAFWFIIGCQSQSLEDKSIQRADDFVELSSNDFLSSTELLTFNYDPRGQFYHPGGNSNSYRVFVVKNTLRLICYSDSCLVDEVFDVKAPFYVETGRYNMGADSIVGYDSKYYHFLESNFFKDAPLLKFQGYQKLLKEFGVFAYYTVFNGDVIKVYLNSNYYLLYSKGELSSEREGILNDKVIKDYQNGWTLREAERELDLG